MAARKLFVFKHDSDLGNAPSHKLFALVKVQKNEDIAAPRKFDDYFVKVEDDVPDGVEMIELL